MMITRKFEFDSAHRIIGHESKCRYLHGHRYVAEVTVSAADLDRLGRVVDFSFMKEIIGRWIDENWDHNMILRFDDPLVGILTKLDPSVMQEVLGGKKTPFLFFKEYGNPTAENIAKYLYNETRDILLSHEVTTGQNLSVCRVRIYETPNCWADFPS